MARSCLRRAISSLRAATLARSASTSATLGVDAMEERKGIVLDTTRANVRVSWARSRE